MEIVLNPTWQEYKKLRLRALETDPKAFGSSLEEELLNPDEKWQKYLNFSIAKQGEVMVFARVEGQLVGMVGAYWDDKKKSKHVATMFGTYVDVEFRGRKIGSMLIENLINELKQIPQLRKIKLAVVSSEIAAIRLYEKYGFEKVGVEKQELYNDPDFSDTILMEKAL
jgi:ribosomal protein S18 acetylase RimI-like enzyme